VSCTERWAWPQVVDDDHYAAFELRGAVLGVFPVEKLAADGRGDPERRRGPPCCAPARILIRTRLLAVRRSK